MKSKIALFLLGLFLILGFSCSSQKEDPQRAKILGHWKLTQWEAEGRKTDLRERDLIYILQNDGSFSFQAQGKEVSQGKWSKRGKVITFQHAGGKAESGNLVELSAEQFVLLSEKDQIRLTFTRIY